MKFHTPHKIDISTKDKCIYSGEGFQVRYLTLNSLRPKYIWVCVQGGHTLLAVQCIFLLIRPYSLSRFALCAAHPDKVLCTPETRHRSHFFTHKYSWWRGNRKKQQLRWRQQKQVRDGWRRRDREKESEWGKGRVHAGTSTLFLSHIFRPHLQLMLPAARSFHNLSHSQLLSTPHRQEFTASSNNYFADLGHYCIMGEYSHVQSPVTVTLSQNCQFNHN